MFLRHTHVQCSVCNAHDCASVSDSDAKYDDVTINIDVLLGPGYKYAGTQIGSQCWCGHTLRSSRRVSDVRCNAPCPGTDGQFCGGHYHVSVYDTGIDGEQLSNSVSFSRRRIRIANGDRLSFTYYLTLPPCIYTFNRRNTCSNQFHIFKGLDPLMSLTV